MWKDHWGPRYYLYYKTRSVWWGALGRELHVTDFAYIFHTTVTHLPQLIHAANIDFSMICLSYTPLSHRAQSSLSCW